jgi:hypothetical protein
MKHQQQVVRWYLTAMENTTSAGVSLIARHFPLLLALLVLRSSVFVCFYSKYNYTLSYILLLSINIIP